jgi:hypothetical protein
MDHGKSAKLLSRTKRVISANRAKGLHNHQLLGHRVVLILSLFQHGKQETYIGNIQWHC